MDLRYKKSIFEATSYVRCSQFLPFEQRQTLRYQNCCLVLTVLFERAWLTVQNTTKQIKILCLAKTGWHGQQLVLWHECSLPLHAPGWRSPLYWSLVSGIPSNQHQMPVDKTPVLSPHSVIVVEHISNNVAHAKSCVANRMDREGRNMSHTHSHTFGHMILFLNISYTLWFCLSMF